MCVVGLKESCWSSCVAIRLGLDCSGLKGGRSVRQDRGCMLCTARVEQDRCFAQRGWSRTVGAYALHSEAAGRGRAV